MRKPKRVFSKKRTATYPFGAYIASNLGAAFAQISIIKAQPKASKEKKIESLIEAVCDFAYAVVNANKAMMQFKFKLTGRYVKPKKRVKK